MTLCDECDNEGPLRCVGCGSGWYCSKECQKKAWSLHKILCKSVKEFQDRPEAEEPGEKYTRAIYFHPDEGAPRFVWLKTMNKDGEYGQPCLTACPGALAAINEKEAESGENIGMTDMSIRHNYALARPLPYNLFLSYRENFLHDGSTHNMAIDKIIVSHSPHLHAWRGPMIAYGTDAFDDVPFSQDPSYSQDLGPSDLRIIAGTFLNIGCKPERADTGFNWGLAPPEWQDDVGSVVIMRKDKKRLVPEHVHALADYHQHRLMDFFEAEEESSSLDVKPEFRRDKAWVMEQITKDKFQKYYMTSELGLSDEAYQISTYDG